MGSDVHRIILLLCCVRDACLCVLPCCSLASASGQHPTSSTTEAANTDCSRRLLAVSAAQHLCCMFAGSTCFAPGRLWTGRHVAASCLLEAVILQGMAGHTTRPPLLWCSTVAVLAVHHWLDVHCGDQGCSSLHCRGGSDFWQMCHVSSGPLDITFLSACICRNSELPAVARSMYHLALAMQARLTFYGLCSFKPTVFVFSS
jgi:hypothetical protein